LRSFQHFIVLAALDCPSSVTGLFSRRCSYFEQSASTRHIHPLWLSTSPILTLICSQSRIPSLSLYSAHAVTV